jgi:hypothetical protein
MPNAGERDYHMRLNSVALATALVLVAGCSSMPPLKVGYYLPTVKTSVTVTQTAACNENGVPFVTSETKFDSIYTREEGGERKTIDLSELDGWFTKSSLTVQFFEDGRLKSINGKQTGSGADGTRTFVSLLPLFGLADFDPTEAKTACDELKKLLGKDEKTLTVVHKGQTSFNESPHPVFTLEQDSLAPETYKKLTPIFGTAITAEYDAKTQPVPHVLDGGDSLKLDLKEPGRTTIRVHITRGSKESVAEEVILVPQHGTDYQLPIQSPPVFGENTMELVLGPVGNVEKLSYGGGGGAPGAATSLSDIFPIDEDETAEDKAAKIKAEADLIYQQQRLVQCRATPADCAK